MVFKLSAPVWQDRNQSFTEGEVSIRARSSFLSVALSKFADDLDLGDLVSAALRLGEEFLDILAIEQRSSRRIVHKLDNLGWRRFSTGLKIYVSSTITISPFVPPLNFTVTNAGGAVIPPPPYVPPVVQAAFRYYRFSESAGNLFEAYRNAYLCLESVLDDIFTAQGKNLGEIDWLEAALNEADKLYSLPELALFDPNATDKVRGFIKHHYEALRCPTFHAKGFKSGALLPGSLDDSEKVRDQLLKLQPLVEALLKQRFNAGLPGGGLTYVGTQLSLNELAPNTVLMTSPQPIDDLVAKFESLAKETKEADPALDNAAIISRTEAVLPFEMLPVTLQGQRPGLPDEWFLYSDVSAQNLKHLGVRSLALLSPHSGNPFVEFVSMRLRQTIPIDFTTDGATKVRYNFRVVLRNVQDTQKSFISD